MSSAVVAASPQKRGLAFRRLPWTLWSPATPDQLTAALSAELGTESISPLDMAASGHSRGERERPLVIAGREASRSPWRFVFRGSVRAGEGGAWLSGHVGPSPAILVTVLAWMSIVAVFFLSGVVAVVVGMLSGQRPLVVPWVLAPAVVLVASYALHHAAWSRAETRWRATEEWLSEIAGTAATSD